MREPLSLDDVERAPSGRTAQRLQWQHLPVPVRATVERRLGSRVVDADSQGSGFTPGFASRLTGADGSRLFVKAASRRAQRHIAASYAEEARKARLLPMDRLPAPRLEWAVEDDSWVVLGFTCVEGRPPRRPWVPEELDRCLASLSEVADVLAEVPPGLDLHPLHEDLPTLVTGWDTVARDRPDWPHLDELRELAHAFADLDDAAGFIHADSRDDNFILTPDGEALLCDWNWPALGPRWLDVVDVLTSAHGDGLDADELLAGHPSTAGVAADDIDAGLAALCGFMVEADDRPAPPSSPYLAMHRRWWSAASWSWLSARRGWR